MINPKFQQIILSALLIVFSIIFLVYFYNLAIATRVSLDNTELEKIQEKKVEPRDFSIDLELFKSNKFKKLKSVNIPDEKFDIGKRNPFETKDLKD